MMAPLAKTVRRTLKAALAALALGCAALQAPGCAAAAADVRTAEVDGGHVAYRVLGHGRPALVLISGLGNGMETFAKVAPLLAEGATVIVYDRAGYGASTAPGGPVDAAVAERELSAVLKASGVAGPFVIAGHSLGGLYAEYFTARHPDQVAGLILEESRTADFTGRCEAAGLSLCVATPAMVTSAPKGAQQEVAGLEAAAAQVAGTRLLADRPVLVLTRPFGAAPTAWQALWTQAQADLAARYPGSRHLTAPAGGHDIHNDQGEWFVASVRAFLATLP